MLKRYSISAAVYACSSSFFSFQIEFAWSLSRMCSCLFVLKRENMIERGRTIREVISLCESVIVMRRSLRFEEKEERLREESGAADRKN
jgi:hypothetical protein